MKTQLMENENKNSVQYVGWSEDTTLLATVLMEKR